MKVLSLDLSTTATGWAEFTKTELKGYGVIKPKLEKGQRKAPYPLIQLYKMMNIAEQILDLCLKTDYDHIIIEEVVQGKNRLGQKTLNGLHWIVVERLWGASIAERIIFKDVSGPNGWRSDLNIKLSAQDKLVNKKNRELNKKIGKQSQKLPLINWKTLSCRYVNKQFGLSLNANKTTSDGDIADAICIAKAFLDSMV